MKHEIVMTAEVLPRTQEILEKEFLVHKLYEAADREAMLKSVAPRVRALATFGPAGANAALMDALPRLELISHFGVGVDSIELAAAKKRNVIVTNTPDVLNDCVADTAMSLVLNVMREFPQSEAFMRSGLWKPAQWPDPAAVPSMAQMLWDQIPSMRAFPTVEQSAANLRERLQTLY